MKSFEKFQYDTSPYEIDEEVEELDEDLVGMVKQGIKATGNVLSKGSEQLKKVGTAVNKGIKSGANIVSNAATPTRQYQPGQQRGSSPSPAPTAPVTKRRNIKSKEFKNPELVPSNSKILYPFFSNPISVIDFC